MVNNGLPMSSLHHEEGPLMSKALVIEVRDRGGRFETAERSIPEPAAGEIRIKVEACGICRGDELCRTGFWPGVSYPRIPGHEVVGTIDADRT